VGNSATTRTKPGGGQPELVVGFGSQGTLRAAVCASPGCGLDHGSDLELPAALNSQRNVAQFTPVPVGDGRSAVVVKVPAKDPAQAWHAVVVAVPGQNLPKVLFKGYTGYVSGQPGLRQGRQVQVSEPVDELGTRRILVGDLHEDLTLCHREALLSPQLLDPQTLELKPAKVQRLTAAERAKAQDIVAQPVVEPAAAPSTEPSTDASTQSKQSSTKSVGLIGKESRLLRAVGASSAVGWPSALTDGNPETTWAENRGGAGRGEFIVMRALSDVPISAFDLLVRPPTKNVQNGVGAEVLWLITTHDVFKVRFTIDPWKTPGVHYRIGLNHPVVTDCVALVTDSAYGESAKSEVTFAELSARTEFETANLDNLMGALAGGGARAESAGSVLSGLGEPAFRAIDAKFNELDEGGRRVALDVVDHGPCEISTPVYIKAILGNIEEQRKHALDRIRRCGDKAKPALMAATGTAEGTRLARIVEALSEVSPSAAITTVVARIGKRPRETRALREVLGRAVQSESANDAIREVLSRADLPLDTTIDFLRALGERANEFGPAAAAWVLRAARESTDWQHRYRLIDAAEPVVASNPGVRDWLARAMTTDESPYVRKQAASVVKLPDMFRNELLAALRDREVRVREAAAQSLTTRAGAFARDALFERLGSDEWPLVRSAAADALSAQAPDGEIDRRLARAMGDSTPLVRSHAIDALGHRQAFAHAPSILERFESRDEPTRVRMSAARALGWLCHKAAIPALQDRALTLRDPALDADQRSLAGVALAALSRIHPSDLQKILAPLLKDKDVNPSVRRAAQAAVDSNQRCGQLH
jgi:HEAT repeat protein